MDLREAEDAARGAARELLGLAEPPDGPRRRARTRSRPGRCAGCATGAGGCRRTSPLASFDELVLADLLDPPVTSLDRHDAELGRRSAELLLGALGTGAPAVPDVHRVAMALRPRRSCGCDAQAS